MAIVAIDRQCLCSLDWSWWLAISEKEKIDRADCIHGHEMVRWLDGWNGCEMDAWWRDLRRVALTISWLAGMGKQQANCAPIRGCREYALDCINQSMNVTHEHLRMWFCDFESEISSDSSVYQLVLVQGRKVFVAWLFTCHTTPTYSQAPTLPTQLPFFFLFDSDSDSNSNSETDSHQIDSPGWCLATYLLLENAAVGAPLETSFRSLLCNLDSNPQATVTCMGIHRERSS
jgi:hypothetical protein